MHLLPILYLVQKAHSIRAKKSREIVVKFAFYTHPAFMKYLNHPKLVIYELRKNYDVQMEYSESLKKKCNN